MANIVVETIEDEVRVALQVDDGSPPTISQQVFPQNYFSESPRFLFASSSPYSVPLLGNQRIFDYIFFELVWNIKKF